MSLLELQADLQGYILGGPDDITDALETRPGADGPRRLRVYHHAYRARLAQVLRETFDKTWSWLGDEAFDRAISTYVEAHPSTHPNLDDYGVGFPSHLAGLWPEDVEAQELAWLDRAMRRVFDGPDAAPIEPAAVAALAPEQWDRARIVLHPTLVVRPVCTHVGALWSGIEAGSPPPPGLPDPDLAVRVWRKGLQPHFRMIDALEARTLAHLSEGWTFAAVCEDLARDGGDAAIDRAAGLLAVWMADELIVDIRI